MQLTLYQVDAFSRRVFAGNPAAVCPLTAWLPDACMQAIANENNLSETAFFVPEGEGYGLRWFTPQVEVELCGHATLATAHVLYTRLGFQRPEVTFYTRSGELRVRREADGRLLMDFPRARPRPVAAPAGLAEALGVEPLQVWFDVDYFCQLPDEATVRGLRPDMGQLKRIETRGICVTAPGEEVDFVSRFFAPAAGIDEDPVTGSAHTALTPLWAERLGKTALHARQVSARGGELWCELQGERVLLAGYAALYMTAVAEVECGP